MHLEICDNVITIPLKAQCLKLWFWIFSPSHLCMWVTPEHNFDSILTKKQANKQKQKQKHDHKFHEKLFYHWCYSLYMHATCCSCFPCRPTAHYTCMYIMMMVIIINLQLRSRRLHVLWSSANPAIWSAWIIPWTARSQDGT